MTEILLGSSRYPRRRHLLRSEGMTMCGLPCPHADPVGPEHSHLRQCGLCLYVDSWFESLEPIQQKKTLFARIHLPSALTRLRRSLDSLLRRDGHPSKAKPVGEGLPETGTTDRQGDERVAIAANLCSGHWSNWSDVQFTHWTWDWVDQSSACGSPHCEQGHHTCDDPAVD